MASVSANTIFISFNMISSVTALFNKVNRSAFSNDFKTYTWQRESNGRMTSNEGFSVVAPIKVTTPVSTALSRESCCDLLKRCISSINRIGETVLKKRLPFAFSITSRTSFTPELIALNV